MNARTLHLSVRRGLAWSTLSNLTLRVGSLVVGICLARLLAPEQFGVYAVALAVQSVLMTLADLGLSADLIRSRDPARKAATVASLGLVGGTAMATTMVVTAPWLADLMGSPESRAPIQVLSLTLIVAGAGVVPYAMLVRGFEQKKIFAVTCVDFVVGTALTLVLVSQGWGAMGLAVGRLAGSVTAWALQLRLARTPLRLGFDASVSAQVLRFGLPVGAANLLSWALLSIDTIVIARSLDAVQLGYYVLAFNVSTWPMTALGQIVRSVALPGFARIAGGTAERRDRSLGAALAPVWTGALVAGVCLALLAAPLVGVVYGEKWAAAAPVLVALGVFGALRVVFDLMGSYLLARGAAGATLAVQVCWLVALIPAVVVGVQIDGLRGAGWAHVAVSLVVIVPAYAIAAHRNGADLRVVAAALWPPVLAVVPAAAAGWGVSSTIGAEWAQLLLGGAAVVVVYGVLIQRWLRARLPRRDSARAEHPDSAAASRGPAEPPQPSLLTTTTQ